MRRQVVLVASIVFTLFVATSYATLMTTKDISLPTYQNCIKLADNNRFYWSVQNDILYGRVIGVGADGGWTAIGFSSGYDYDLPPPEPDVSGIPKMAGATIYMAYRDTLYNYYVNEYYSSSEQQPQLIPQQNEQLNMDQTVGRSVKDGDFHFVFQRPLIATQNVYTNYYQFTNPDKSNVLFAKNSLTMPEGANTFMRHNEAELRKINFFQSYSECGSSNPPLPDYITPISLSQLPQETEPVFSSMATTQEIISIAFVAIVVFVQFVFML